MAMSADDPYLAEPGHLPTPFTADQLREGCPDGRTLLVRTEPAGQEAHERVVRFVEGDADGVVQVRSESGPGGSVGPELGRSRSTWRELQAHASYPAGRTTRERVRLEHPLGDLDCLRYTMGDGDAVDQAWFDVDRPGMPVLLESRRGADLLVRVVVLADEVRPV
jgi:hypothetical protein